MTPLPFALLFKELKTMFLSPIAYALAATFLLIMGYTFTLALFYHHTSNLVQTTSQAAMLFLVLVPIITMRQLAEERRGGTLELILSNATGELELVLAKFFAALTLIVCLLLPTLAYPITLQILGQPDWGPIYTGYCALFLLGAALIAIGLAFSAMTSNQIIAAAGSFGVAILLWSLDATGAILPEPYGSFVINASLVAHFAPMVSGAVYLSDIGYFLSVCLIGLLIAVRALKRR